MQIDIANIELEEPFSEHDILVSNPFCQRDKESEDEESDDGSEIEVIKKEKVVIRVLKLSVRWNLRIYL